jgi:hypothetical protein
MLQVAAMILEEKLPIGLTFVMGTGVEADLALRDLRELEVVGNARSQAMESTTIKGQWQL